MANGRTAELPAPVCLSEASGVLRGEAMDGEVALEKRTTKAAIRLLKSKIREHIYTTKAAEGESRWNAMLIVEQGFARPAHKEWEEVLEAWDPLDDAKCAELRRLVSEAFAPAASEVLSIFDDDQLWPMRKLIESYHRAFQADELLKKNAA